MRGYVSPVEALGCPPAEVRSIGHTLTPRRCSSIAAAAAPQISSEFDPQSIADDYFACADDFDLRAIEQEIARLDRELDA